MDRQQDLDATKEAARAVAAALHFSGIEATVSSQRSYDGFLVEVRLTGEQARKLEARLQ